MDTIHRSLLSFLNFLSGLLVIAALYLGREILMPVALACLLTFLLHPLVNYLCRLRIPRMLSVCIVTVSSFCALALIAWLLGSELARLASDLPNYRHNIQQRVIAVQRIGDTRIIQRLRQLVGDVSESTQQAEVQADPALNPPPAAEPPAQPPATPPPNVETALMKTLNMIVPTLANVLGTAALVTLFVIFMLLRLNDINQRIARLVGHSRLTLTTKAIEESGERISHYLLMQGTINAGYGLLLAAGLAALGLPYVVLWGVMAAMARFIPYVGPWLAAVVPVAVSLAVFDGWSHPLMVIGFIATLELVTNMIIEPLLYGQSAGVSDFALLLAIAFWTWLWGGVGLVLATPLTVCIVVFCKRIPSMEWVDVMMGENPQPQPHLSYYQYHLADNEDAAQDLLEATMRKEGLDTALEKIAMPATALTRREEVLGNLDLDEAAQMYHGMRTSLVLLKEGVPGPATPAESVAQPAAEPPPALRVFARALNGEADQQVLEMLQAMLPPGIEMEMSDEPRLIGELVEELESKAPSILCISALPPRAQLSAITLCRRLRNKLPGLKILVCRWGLPGETGDPKPLRESGATWVVSSLHEARTLLQSLLDSNGTVPPAPAPLRS